MFVPGKAFQPSLMFAGKAEYLSEAQRCSILGQAPGLTQKHKTRLESLAKDEHSSLLRKTVNCGRKKFYRIDPGRALFAILNVYTELIKLGSVQLCYGQTFCYKNSDIKTFTAVINSASQ